MENAKPPTNKIVTMDFSVRKLIEEEGKKETRSDSPEFKWNPFQT
jgi:hypothetical protein